MTDAPIPPVVLRALAAANAWRTTEFLDCFAPDGAVDDWGRVFRGHGAIRRWSDAEFIGVHVVLTATAVTDDGPTTTVAAQVGGDGYNGASHFAFTAEDGLITLMRITG